MQITMMEADATDPAATIEQLSDVLIDRVHGGASVSFMLPIARDTARLFWQEVLASLTRRERIQWQGCAQQNCRHGAVGSCTTRKSAASRRRRQDAGGS